MRLLVLLVVLLKLTFAERPVILQPLSDITAAASDGEVELACKVQAQSLHWFVNDTWYYSKTAQLLLRSGLQFSDLVYDSRNIITGRVVIDVSAHSINNTILECDASDNLNHTVSTNCTVLIAGVPLPPNPSFSVLDADTIGIKWDAPFTWPAFPIILYTLLVMNQTNKDLLVSVSLVPEILYHNITRPSSSCDDIAFLVSASNRVGASPPGETVGHFSAVPGMLKQHEVKISVLFVSEQPRLNVTFTCPFLCMYSKATYSLTISDVMERNVEVISGPHFISWHDSGMPVSTEVTGLLSVETSYILTVVVETIAGQSSIHLHFSIDDFNTCLSEEKHSADLLIVCCGVSGGLFIILCCLQGGFAIGYKCCYERKSKQTAADLAHDLSYGGSSVYEEIPENNYFKQPPQVSRQRLEGYVSITAKTQSSEQPGMCSNEEMYTVMNSAGTVSAQLTKQSC